MNTPAWLATSNEKDARHDRLAFEAGMTMPLTSMPSSESLLVLAQRVALWELVSSALAIANAHGAVEFRVMTDTRGQLENGSHPWRMEVTLVAGGPWIGEDAGSVAPATDLADDLEEWTQDIDAALLLTVSDRFQDQVLGQRFSVDQSDEIQRIIFGDPLMAHWRAQRTAEWAEPDTELTTARQRARQRP